MITHKKYILASSSKSRYSILKKISFPFVKIKPLCNEEEIKKKIKKKTKPSIIARKLSYEKAKSVSLLKDHHNNPVIGCDTLIYLDGTVFDKASTLNEAKIKIRKLSGKTHNIVSGLSVCREGRLIWQCSSTTSVKIRKLNNNEINTYLSMTGKHILSSVGCYQIEAMGPNIIEDIRGDYFNVMGLPLFKLLKYVSSKK